MKLIFVLPVYNEEKIIASSLQKLHNYCSEKFITDDWNIIVANNASTDNTKKITEQIITVLPHIQIYDTPIKGRGHALKEVWSTFTADIYFYCDVDLATDIQQLEELVNTIKQGTDIVIGSRYRPDSKIQRHLHRLIISKIYNWIIKTLFHTTIKDFQCGFKAINQKTKEQILPLTKNNYWFFDTELLLLAEAQNFQIKEVPVQWQENKETKVQIIKNSFGFLKCLTCFFLNSKLKKTK